MIPRTSCRWVGHAVDAAMPNVADRVHELFAPPGAASHAGTSYVPARAGATAHAPKPAAHTARAIENRQSKFARAGAIDSPFGMRVHMSAGSAPVPSDLAPPPAPNPPNPAALKPPPPTE